MSLIRSTSNHEKIYAYHNINGNTCIHKGPNRTICIDTKIFDKVIKRWLDTFEDFDIEIDGFKLTTRFMYGLRTIILSHSGTHIAMSYATFSYMIDRYIFEYYKEIGAI